MAMKGEGPGEAQEKLQEAKELAEWQARRKAGTAAPFDQPDGALAFYLLKRVPDGQVALDSTTLIRSATAGRIDGLYSTARHAFVTAAGAGNRRETMLVNGHNTAGTWTPMGPGNVGGRTRSILIHPTTPNIMWAGAVAGGNLENYRRRYFVGAEGGPGGEYRCHLPDPGIRAIQTICMPAREKAFSILMPCAGAGILNRLMPVKHGHSLPPPRLRTSIMCRRS